MLLKSDGTLVDGAGGVYSVTPEGLLVGPDGVVFGATGLLMTPAGVAQNAAVSFSDGAVLANGSGVAAGSKIVVKKQVLKDMTYLKISKNISPLMSSLVYRHASTWSFFFLSFFFQTALKRFLFFSGFALLTGFQFRTPSVVCRVMAIAHAACRNP